MLSMEKINWVIEDISTKTEIVFEKTIFEQLWIQIINIKFD